MLCPLCHQRQARRACPALGKRICAVCCGTKRQGEIACPADCGYLAAAQVHPPAAVRRQQERDLALLMAMRQGLSNREAELLWVLLTFIAGLEADPLVRLVDADVAEASAAMAATYETANRGLIYEHRPASLSAQRLVTDLKTFIGTILQEADAAATRTVERDLAVVLRHLEEGARAAVTVLPEGGPTAMLEAIRRAIPPGGRGEPGGPAGRERQQPEAPGPVLIRP